MASPDRPGLLEGHRQACAGLKTPRSGLEVTRCYFRRCPRSSDSSPTHMRGGGPQPRSVRMLRGLPGPGSPTSGPCGPNEPPAQPVGSQGLCHLGLHPSCRHPLQALVSSPPSSSGAARLACHLPGGTPRLPGGRPASPPSPPPARTLSTPALTCLSGARCSPGFSPCHPPSPPHGAAARHGSLGTPWGPRMHVSCLGRAAARRREEAWRQGPARSLRPRGHSRGRRAAGGPALHHRSETGGCACRRRPE